MERLRKECNKQKQLRIEQKARYEVQLGLLKQSQDATRPFQHVKTKTKPKRVKHNGGYKRNKDGWFTKTL